MIGQARGGDKCERGSIRANGVMLLRSLPRAHLKTERGERDAGIVLIAKVPIVFHVSAQAALVVKTRRGGGCAINIYFGPQDRPIPADRIGR